MLRYCVQFGGKLVMKKERRGQLNFFLLNTVPRLSPRLNAGPKSRRTYLDLRWMLLLLGSRLVLHLHYLQQLAGLYIRLFPPL